LRPAANEYRRRGLKTAATRDAWLAEDPAAKSERRAEYERLRLAYNEFTRLYSKATRGKQKALTKADADEQPGMVETPLPAASEQDTTLSGNEGQGVSPDTASPKADQGTVWMAIGQV
jgi:hypothetical protein